MLNSQSAIEANI